MAKPSNFEVRRLCRIHGLYTGEQCPACAAALEQEQEEATPVAVAEPPKSGERRAVCACGHTERDHCKGGVPHTYYKVRVGQASRPSDTTICGSRHCLAPICTCLHYTPAPTGQGATS